MMIMMLMIIIFVMMMLLLMMMIRSTGACRALWACRHRGAHRPLL